MLQTSKPAKLNIFFRWPLIFLLSFAIAELLHIWWPDPYWLLKVLSICLVVYSVEQTLGPRIIVTKRDQDNDIDPPPGRKTKND